MKPTHREMLKIAVEGHVCLNTVKTVYDGGGSENSRGRVKQAAKKLRLPEPEDK